MDLLFVLWCFGIVSIAFAGADTFNLPSVKTQRPQVKHTAVLEPDVDDIDSLNTGALITMTNGIEIMEERDIFKEIMKFQQKNWDRVIGNKAVKIQASSSNWRSRHTRVSARRTISSARNQHLLPEKESNTTYKDITLHKGDSSIVSPSDSIRDSHISRYLSKELKWKSFGPKMKELFLNTRRTKPPQLESERGDTEPKGLKSFKSRSPEGISAILRNGWKSSQPRDLLSKKLKNKKDGLRGISILSNPLQKDQEGLDFEIDGDRLSKVIKMTKSNSRAADHFRTSKKNRNPKQLSQSDVDYTSKKVSIEKDDVRHSAILSASMRKSEEGLYPERHKVLFNEDPPANYRPTEISSTSQSGWFGKNDVLKKTSSQDFNDSNVSSEGSGSLSATPDHSRKSHFNEIQTVIPGSTSFVDSFQIFDRNEEQNILTLSQPFFTTTTQPLSKETQSLQTSNRNKKSRRHFESTPSEGILGLMKLSPVDVADNSSGSLVCESGYVEYGGACRSVCDITSIYCENEGHCVIVENVGAMCRCLHSNILCSKGECCVQSFTSIQIACIVGSCCVLSVLLGSLLPLILRKEEKVVPKFGLDGSSRLWISTFMPQSSDSFSSISETSDFTWTSQCSSLPDMTTFGNTKVRADQELPENYRIIEDCEPFPVMIKP